MSIETNRYLRLSQVQELVPMATSTIYGLMSKGLFPKPIKLGERAVAWSEQSIRDYLASCPEMKPGEFPAVKNRKKTIEPKVGELWLHKTTFNGKDNSKKYRITKVDKEHFGGSRFNEQGGVEFAPFFWDEVNPEDWERIQAIPK